MNINDNGLFKRRNRSGIRGRNKNQNVITVQRAQRTEGSNVSKIGNNSSSSNSASRSNQKSDTPHQTSSSKTYSEADSRTIVAVTEGRGQASWEIGLAAIDLNRPSIILCQFADTQSYINTLTKINILNAMEIVVPNTFVTSANNRLLEKIKEQFRNVNITAVSRSTFNNTNGLQLIKKVCLSEFNSVTLIIQHRYYALTAASALINYIENVLNIVYAYNSLKVEYQESEGYAIIDISTADNLELVASTCVNLSNSKYSSLFGVLNHCLTKIGARTLRSAILQPPCNAPDIEARLDCVQELIDNYHMLTAVQAILSKLSNIDQILSLSSVLAKTDNNGESQLNYALLLNCLLELISPLKDVFENSTQPFFMELRNILDNAAFLNITALLRMLIQNDAHPAKGSQGITQRCFAIKCGVNGLLDNVRKSYTERIEDLRDYAKKLGEKYNLPLVLQNNNRNGYHLYLVLNSQQRRTFKKSDLPSEFIYVERQSNSFILKTEELVNKSTRIDDILTEILKISKKIIHSTLLAIKQDIPLFYKLCELVAKLDMFQSLAQASKDGNYVRPKFKEVMKIKQSRHPLLEYLCMNPPVPNDVLASRYKNLTVVTGPNGSGKSVYIRQILLLQVMAQVGCFVPAQSAIFRISDRILARVFLEDSLDNGVSTFVLEIKEIQCFMNIMTPNTLMIVDEFARSTGEGEGTALAAAVAEKLASTNAFVFFTTHYKFLTKLADMYYNIQNLHLDTSEQQSERGILLKYTYNVVAGTCNLDKYGISLARIFWPESITKEAENILSSFEEHTKWTTITEVIDKAKRLKYELESKFCILKEEGRLNVKSINEQLKKYQNGLLSIGYKINISPYSDSSAKATDTQGCSHSTDLFQNRLFTVDDNYLNDGYYIHPQVVYSPNRGDITIQLPEEQFFCNQGNIFPKVSLNSILAQPPHMEHNYHMDNPNQLDSLLEEDMGDFQEFSRNFDETSFGEQQQQNESLWNFIPLQNILDEIRVENVEDNNNNTCEQNQSSSESMNNKPSSQANRDQRFVKSDVSLKSKNLQLDNVATGEESNSISEGSFFNHLMTNNEISSTPLILNENNKNPTKLNLRNGSVNENPFNDTNITDVLQSLRPSVSTSLEKESMQKGNNSSSCAELNRNADVSEQCSSNISLIAHKDSDSSASLFDDKPKPSSRKTNDTFSPQKKKICKAKTNSPTTLPRSSKNVTKKKKPTFKTPLKECDIRKFGIIKSYNTKSMKEIRKEFDKQSNEILESCNSSQDISKYMKYIEHRPTVEQMKQVTTVALIHKTDDGVVVMPPPPETKRKKRKYDTPLRTPNNLHNFHVSFLSDENSESFEKFLQSKDKVPIHQVCTVSENSFKRQRTEITNDEKYITQDHKDINISVISHIQRSATNNQDSFQLTELIKKYVPNCSLSMTKSNSDIE